MALDPNASTRTQNDRVGSVIDNEIPAYRAVSALAITSLLLGLLTTLTFVDLNFLLAGVAAILTGVLAQRKIARMPDVLTGASMAKVGIVLAIFSGLFATTHSYVDAFLRDRQINQFADFYLKELRSKSPDDVLWYHQRPEVRAAKTPQQVRDEALKAGQMTKMEHDNRIKTIERLQAALASGGELHREALEISGYDGLVPYGAVLLELHDSKVPIQPGQTDLCLLEIKGERKAGKYNWWVGELRADYKPKSYEHKEKPVDDGHGHGAGGHGH